MKRPGYAGYQNLSRVWLALTEESPRKGELLPQRSKHDGDDHLRPTTAAI